MKKIFTMLALVTIMIGANVPSFAQFKIGPRVGLEVNKMHFNNKVLDGDNRAGFTAGVEGEFTVPAVGVGLDASLMYVRRTANFMEKNGINSNRDYFAIPVNLKWKFNIPVINNIARPYIFTGPEFAFLTSRKSIENALYNKKTDISWNVGAGVELVKHLQVGASYGIGLSKSVESMLPAGGGQQIEGKNRYWTVTAAWLF